LWEELRLLARNHSNWLSARFAVETTKGHPQQWRVHAAVEPFHQRAAAFRKELVASDPGTRALIAFASRAYVGARCDEASELRETVSPVRKHSAAHEAFA